MGSVVKQFKSYFGIIRLTDGFDAEASFHIRPPLYGRATAQLKLQPLSFSVTSDFFPQYSPMEEWNSTLCGVVFQRIGNGSILIYQ